MTRKDTTDFLGNLVIDRIGHRGSYWAKEVSIDYGTKDVKRVDFLQFSPAGVMNISEIEKGIFTCYEVKSCKEDVFSGNGLNFLGERNYIVTTMECYKSILEEFRSGKLDKHIDECCPNSSHHYGIMVAVPRWRKETDEFENPTEITKDIEWMLSPIIRCRQGNRKRSMTELLFCMLRSGQ